MTTYIIRRLLMGILIVWLVTIIIFFVIRLLPGDPLVIFLGQQAQSGSVSTQQMEVLRHQYWLDRPIIVQYFHWVGGVVRGNLGESIYYHENVGKLMLARFPITLHLGLTSFVLANVLGIAMGVIAAIRRNTWIDAVVTTVANVGITIPVFWLGILLIYLFGMRLNWLPITGYTSPFTDFWMSFKQLIMPVSCLTVTMLAGTARQTRSSMLEVIRQDFIRTAWSKGLAEKVIITRHALKISLLPVLTLMGIGVGLIIGGSVLVETVFAIPGMGRLLTTSIFAQDYTVIQGGTLVISLIIILANLFVDIAYGWVDPRIRYS
jgi:peptide/nickel transport system permease protein